jgi:hypothetical protein
MAGSFGEVLIVDGDDADEKVEQRMVEVDEVFR